MLVKTERIADGADRAARVALYLQQASALFRIAETIDDPNGRKIVFEAAFDFEQLAREIATIH